MKSFLFFLALSLLSTSAAFGDLTDVDDLDGKDTAKPTEIKKPPLPDDEAVKEEKPPTPPPKRKEPTKDGKAAAKKKNEKKEPIRLKSDGKSTYSRNGGLIHLERNVVITQGDLRFQADEARVFVRENGPTDDNIEKVEVIGNVNVTKFSDDPAEKMSAKGERAYFYNDKRKVTLVGNARLWKGGHLFKGREISYDLNKDEITVDKAEGVLRPGEAKK